MTEVTVAGAQTKRQGNAGPVRGLLRGKAPPAVNLFSFVVGLYRQQRFQSSQQTYAGLPSSSATSFWKSARDLSGSNIGSLLRRFTSLLPLAID